jgi:mono/diheme cytochrome c family protein
MRALAASLALLALTACPRLDPMQRQQKYKAYQPAEAQPGELAMRHPPAGTVPYRSVVDPAVSTGLGPDGLPLAQAPLPVTAATLARGRNRFDVYCATCHGLLGDGESQVALNMSLRKPPSLHAYRDVPDGHLYRVVANGFGLMPPYAPELSIEDRWAVVAYVRALQLSQHATLNQLPPEARQRLEKEAR